MQTGKFFIGKANLVAIAFLAINLILVSPQSARAETWYKIDLPTSAYFNHVSGVSPNEVYIMSGTSAYRYDGVSFTEMTLPALTSWYYTGLDGDTGISVTTVIQKDAGDTWSNASLPTDCYLGLNDVSVSPAGGLAVAVGDGETLRRQGGWNLDCSNWSGGDEVYVADDSSYYVVRVGALVFWWFDGTWHVDNGYGTYGNPGTTGITVRHIWGSPSGTSAGQMYTTGLNTIGHFDGSNWTLMAHPYAADPDFNFTGIVESGGTMYAYGSLSGGLGSKILKLSGGVWIDISPPGAATLYDMWGSGGDLFAVGVEAVGQMWTTKPPAPTYQLNADVIQTIQDPVKYVTGKPIYVRAYVTCTNCDTGQTLNATATLTVGNATAVISQQIQNDPANTVATLRDQPAKSFNFLLPAYEFETDNSVLKNLELVVDLDNGSGIITKQLTTAITVEHRYPLIVGVIKLRIINGSEKYYVDNDQLANSERFMEMVYPGKVVFLHLGFVDIDVTEITDLPAETATDNDGNPTAAAIALARKNKDLRTMVVRNYLARLHMHHVFKNTPGFIAADYIFGIWSPDGPGMDGEADAYWWPDHVSGYVSHGFPGPTMAHEVGHSLGLGHTAWDNTGFDTEINADVYESYCPKRDVPAELDPAKAELVMGRVPDWHNYTWDKSHPFTDVYGYTYELDAEVIETNYFDFMSYCNDKFEGAYPSGVLNATDAWVSDTHYNQLINILSTPELPHSPSTIGQPGKKLGKLPAQKAIYYTTEEIFQYLLVHTNISDDATVAELSTEELTGNILLPRSTVIATDTNYCIETRNVADAVLDTQCFDLIFRNINMQPLSTISIQANMNFDPSINSVVIKQGATVIGTLTRSPNIPAVSQVTITPAAGNETTICWSAVDTDGDTLSYMLEYSADAGAGWQPVVLDWRNTCYTVDHGSLPASLSGRVRITASDGLNTASPVESSTPFLVSDQGPEISLAHAGVVCDLDQGEQFLLSARAYDVEDGVIGAADITWQDASGQVLGKEQVSVSIASQTEYYTVTASDSSGNSTQQEVILNLPTGLGADLDCDSMPDGYEVTYGLDPQIHDAAGDLDGDNLTNLEEFQLGSYANNTDSDGDGIEDGAEVDQGRNPVVNEAVIIQIINSTED